jgi:hypothetical protein
MFSITVKEEGREEIDRFFTQAYQLFDFRPLAQTLAGILRDQNARTRSSGLDKNDVPFLPLAESTMKKRVRQGRMGPPLAPDGASSAIVAGFSVYIDDPQPDDITLTGYWPTVDWVGYHMEPWGTRPVRDAVGIPPPDWDRIDAAFHDFIASILGTY